MAGISNRHALRRLDGYPGLTYTVETLRGVAQPTQELIGPRTNSPGLFFSQLFTYIADMKPGDWVRRHKWPEPPNGQYRWQTPDVMQMKFLLLGVEGKKAYVAGPDNQTKEVEASEWRAVAPMQGDTLEEALTGRKGVVYAVHEEYPDTRLKVRWRDGAESTIDQSRTIPLNSSAMMSMLHRVNSMNIL